MKPPPPVPPHKCGGARLYCLNHKLRTLVTFCRDPLLIFPIPGEVLIRVRGFDPRLFLAYRVHHEGSSASSALGK